MKIFEKYSADFAPEYVILNKSRYIFLQLHFLQIELQITKWATHFFGKGSSINHVASHGGEGGGDAYCQKS